MELPGCRKFPQARTWHHVSLKQNTFFKIKNNRIFEKPYAFEAKFFMGEKLDEINVNSTLQLWIFQDKQLPSIWNNSHQEKREYQDSCSWKAGTLAQDSDLVTNFREMSHEHRNLGLHLTRWIVGNQSKPWWKFALYAGVQSAVFYWTILYFSEKVPKQICCHEIFLSFNTSCFNNDLGLILRNQNRGGS